MLKTQKPKSELAGMVSKFILENLPEQFFAICDSESQNELNQNNFEEVTVFDLEHEKGENCYENQDISSPRLFDSSIPVSGDHTHTDLFPTNNNAFHSHKKDLISPNQPSENPRRMTLASQPKKCFLNFGKRKYQKASVKGKHEMLKLD